MIEAAEILQLSAPDFLVAYKRTEVVIHGPRAFRDMDGSDRIRACYQHCVLQYVLRKQMTNSSLRQRFGLNDKQSNIASSIIAATVGQGLIKSDLSGSESRKHARYVPLWA